MPRRKIDIARFRKDFLPKNVLVGPKKGKAPIQVFIDELKKGKKNLEIEDKDERLIVWETIDVKE